MKKFWTIVICAMLLGAVAFAAVGCNKGAADTINVFSREDGSGTRSAFTELTGVLVENEDGTETDMTFSGASFQNSTNAIMTAVAQDKNAIGYVSFGSLNDTVKAVAVNGVAPSVDTIKDKSYELQRPFNIAYKKSNIDSKPLAADFLGFLGSAEAQEVIAAEKYIVTDDNAPAYAKGSDLTGSITIGGSSSVSPLMEKLIEKYCALSGVAKNSIELQTIDSSTSAWRPGKSKTPSLSRASPQRCSPMTASRSSSTTTTLSRTFLWSRSVRSSPARCASGPPLHN